LVMAAAFKFNAGDVHVCDNREVLLFLTSGIVPFFLITIFQKIRFSLPLSFSVILLVHLYFWLLRQHQFN